MKIDKPIVETMATIAELRSVVAELREELKELRTDFKTWQTDTNNLHQEMTKLLATHNEQILNLQTCQKKAEEAHNSLVLKLWGLAAATFIALITAVLSFLFKQ